MTSSIKMSFVNGGRDKLDARNLPRRNLRPGLALLACLASSARVTRCASSISFVRQPGSWQPIDAVERCDTITFCQGWIVEDGVDEVIDFSLESHDGLADMNELRGPFSDGMNAQEHAGVAMKEQLDHTGLIADELSSGDFPIVCDADPIGNLCLGQFFLVPPHCGDFRNGIDAVWQEVCVGAVGIVKSMTGGVASLLHGGGGQGGKTDDVTDGVDMGN